ncbi:MAG: hypothetical protein GXO79_06975, partial [Chlorobi bacterium]|nr:hypothetical protein [Chlorobiota bacterium]
SCPAQEGKIQAKNIAIQNHNVNLIVDSAFGKYIDTFDFAILGADVVFAESFINKIGSLIILEIMKLKKIPSYVIFDSRKFISNNCDKRLIKNFKTEKLKPANEIWEDAPENIHIKNYYFEEVPNKIVNSFINENGIIPSNNIYNSLQITHSKYFHI